MCTANQVPAPTSSALILNSTSRTSHGNMEGIFMYNKKFNKDFVLTANLGTNFSDQQCPLSASLP